MVRGKFIHTAFAQRHNSMIAERGGGGGSVWVAQGGGAGVAQGGGAAR